MFNMLSLIENKQQKNTHKKLNLREIEKYYKEDKKEFLIGLEYERLSLDKKTLKNAPYESLEKIIKHFASISSWELICDNKTIIGAFDSDGTSISLEPGCQLEISFAPKKDIFSIQSRAEKIIKLLDKIADVYNVVFVGYGISPVSLPDDIELLEKRRYQIMNNYMPKCRYGELAPKMMRQTAGIQINIDYKDSNDAFLKLKFFNLIMPFMMGLCANSPFEANKMSDKTSLRANVWRYTGQERCNCFYKNIFKGVLASKNIFKNYISEILNVPMIFIERDNKMIEFSGKINFKEFLKYGYKAHQATMEDYILQQSLCFPDVRLKKYIEIRNHDSSDIEMALSLCAFYKGLSNCDIKKVLSKLEFLKLEKIEEYNKEIIFKGLNYRINNKIDGWSVVATLFRYAKANLSARERVYLEPILNILKTRKTKADLIIDADIKTAKELIQFLY